MRLGGWEAGKVGGWDVRRQGGNGTRISECGMQPPGYPSCRLYPPERSRLPLRDGVEPEAIGACANTPAC